MSPVCVAAGAAAKLLVAELKARREVVRDAAAKIERDSIVGDPWTQEMMDECNMGE